ncbi:MAG TPA: PilX N-terminal domain-containing pilus assembly protein [Thermoanaerobaculia bacterium]|nr:PilX N-terminal domain-containing pilus assembly protein [Thermoanaerobaculia bacterium]
MQPESRASEHGSAYILVLLVLVVLSLIGVAVVFVSQTEMEIGSNERGIQRIFYAAESGVALASARVLVSNDHRPIVFDLREPGSGVNLRHVIELAPVVPIYDAPCNLCEINNAGTYQEKAYRKINNAITVEATRTAGRNGRELGTRTVASMLELQPWKSPVEAYLAIGDESQLAKIRK